jgi:hypothetical protein
MVVTSLQNYPTYFVGSQQWGQFRLSNTNLCIEFLLQFQKANGKTIKLNIEKIKKKKKTQRQKEVNQNENKKRKNP